MSGGDLEITNLNDTGTMVFFRKKLVLTSCVAHCLFKYMFAEYVLYVVHS